MRTIKMQRMNNPQSAIRNPQSRSAFTLMELLVVIMILSILAAMTVVGLAAAVNDARLTRTRSVINKIDLLIQERWEGYRTRSVSIRIPPRLGPMGSPTTAVQAAQIRLAAIRELQKLEFPDQISDLCTVPEYLELSPPTGDNKLDAIANMNDVRRFTGIAMPALARSYKRMAARNIQTSGQAWTPAFQGAECLYLILSTMKDHDKSALDYFSTDEIGDVDGDGFKEILDGWGRPIEFLRWAPGYCREQPGPDLAWGEAGTDDDGDSATDEFDGEFYFAGTDDFLWTSTSQTRDSRVAPDPFDPLRVDPRWTNPDPASKPYEIRPLIYSAGQDGSYDINVGGGDQATNVPPNDPYIANAGIPLDTNGDNVLSNDNITNHAPETAPQ